ncbi:hypothetical protein QNO07_19800 [Streptomyces sp. 549]|uniref:hypothetical protein n=1 Tax=Streptomyces sp. 549 TaxID=3049076 RepID=UPI0024C30BB0|nr:hypothetical protein [Streptomyces sp. 549]MDK1475631.1 hypothetical protein [Streptomyces sp. 549]
MDQPMPGGQPGHATTAADGEPAARPRPPRPGTVPTGNAEVDAQLRRLDDADHLAVSGHLDVYEDVHRGLRSTLTALDQHDPGS